MLQELINMQQTGTLKKLVRAGLVSAKVNTYLEIYMYVDARNKASNKRKGEVIKEAAEQFNVNRQTIYNALRVVKG